jgi:hypothetical protein
MTSKTELPDVAEILGPVLARVPIEEQPLLMAIAERMAAERYRDWSQEISDSDRERQLLECAEREEEIAQRVESLHPDAKGVQEAIVAQNPNLVEINRSLFAGRPLPDQFTIQSRGERVGAATWRSFAVKESRSEVRDVLLICAGLEEENARVLESFLTEGVGR